MNCELQTVNPSVSEASALVKQDEVLGEARTARAAFSGRTFRELQEDPTIPTFEYAVQGMMSMGEVSMIVADAKLGKTWLGFQLAVCAAKGLKFLDRKVRKSHVVYVDLEMGSIDERQRSLAVARKLGVRDEDLEIAFVAGDEQEIPPTIDNLEEGLAAFLKERGWEFKNMLLIIDTYGEVIGQIDETTATATRVALGKLRRLARRRNCAVLLFHHTRKQGDTYRGSSAIRGAVDNLFYLRWARMDERALSRLGKGKNFVVLEDDARRRRAPFESLHLNRVLIESDSEAVIAGVLGQGPACNLGSQGFIWESLGPVGGETGVPQGDTVYVEDRQADEGGGMEGMEAVQPDAGTEVRTGAEERAAVVASVFLNNDEKVTRSELEERYAKKQGLGKESGKKAVKEAVNLGWIVKTGAGQRAPYELTGLGIRERGRMPPSLLRPPATSEQCRAAGFLSLDDLFADNATTPAELLQSIQDIEDEGWGNG